ncbi:hypothetical protein HGM15179_000437 [Zosterops borbonicus]|uniref:Uncharacterized protein n=1 Tax=Zosterops borbonicus TaxID=364589 RepID=A0A8K1GZE9_9PASS|nr:hypothetical protein HGM15179_000437 [Zosterops borbonicus]
MVKTMVRQIVLLQPMEAHGKVLIHLQTLGVPTLEQKLAGNLAQDMAKNIWELLSPVKLVGILPLSFMETDFSMEFSALIALQGIVVTHTCAGPDTLPVESYKIGLGPSIQPVQIPLQSHPVIWHTNSPTPLGVICEFDEGALNLIIQIIDKDIKQD